MKGNQPMNTKIEDSIGKGDSLQCKIDLNILKEELKNKYNICVSNDAGDYICNYAYFNSLNSFEKHCPHALCLFVHIPSFDEINQDIQFNFALDLLRAISGNVNC